MKKTITFITAMLITATAFTGCNSSLDDSNTSDKPATSDSSEQDTGSPADNEEKVIDVFENIDYSIVENTYYPNGLKINFDASNTPFGQEMKFTYFVESANRDGVVIKAKADIDDVKKIIKENNYVVEETEKTFTIPIEEMNTPLISANQLTDENKLLIIEEMTKGICSYNGEIELNLENFYIFTTKEDYLFPTTDRKPTSIISLDENSFEERYLNTCKFEFIFGHYFYIIGTFVDNKGNHYSAAASPLLEKGKVTSFNPINSTVLIDTIVGGTCSYPDEESAYEVLIDWAIRSDFADEDVRETIEVPLS